MACSFGCTKWSATSTRTSTATTPKLWRWLSCSTIRRACRRSPRTFWRRRNFRSSLEMLSRPENSLMISSGSNRFVTISFHYAKRFKQLLVKDTLVRKWLKGCLQSSQCYKTFGRKSGHFESGDQFKSKFWLKIIFFTFSNRFRHHFLNYGKSRFLPKRIWLS